MDDLLPRHLTTIDVHLGRVANLTSPSTLAELGLTGAFLSDDDLRVCQAMGDAVHYLGFEAILAPSVAAPALTLAIFLNSILGNSSLEVVETELLDAGELT